MQEKPKFAEHWDKEELAELVDDFAFALYEDARDEQEKDLSLRLLKTADRLREGVKS